MKDLGVASYIIGIKLLRDRWNKMLGLSQAAYIDKIFIKFAMHNSKKRLLPFRHGVSLSMEQCPKTLDDEQRMKGVPYAFVIGSLMYIMLCTRLDIYYAVGMVNRYQSNLGSEHKTTLKYSFKYLRRTRDYMLTYEGLDLILVSYTNLDFLSDMDSRKLTSIYVFTLGETAISYQLEEYKAKVYC